MAIREEVINGALAELLTSTYGVHAVAEDTKQKKRGKICDVKIREKHGERSFAAVECKIGQDKTKQKEAIKAAQRWTEESDCLCAIAVCYEPGISRVTKKTPRQKLEESTRLLMAKVDQSGLAGEWHSGRVSDLVNLSSDIAPDETSKITEILRAAIEEASESLSAISGEDLAKALELPWDPEREKPDPRPARIACLIVANMALLQNRMHSSGIRIDGLGTLLDVQSARNKQRALLAEWKKIRKVDYAPVVDPAILVLETLPSDHHTEELLERLIKAVFDCAPLMHDLRLDHAGPLYHSLLQTAKYDGSFYTSTAASVLLAELAMGEEWLNVPDWSDAGKLGKLKICDPACGTGTLLMAAARTIEERFRLAGGGGGRVPAPQVN